MADTKLSALVALGAAPATGDLIYIDDVSAGASKSMTVLNLFTSPALVTPALGTPASGTLTNCTGLPQAGTVGLTTADSPQFAGLNVGAASDTTITRTGAGDIAVEGNGLYRAGGTDVPVTDGGTGASTAAGAVTNLGLDNTKIASVGITIDGGGSAITTGVKGYIEIPYACTINRVTTLADQSGSIVIDIWKDTYANYPPTVADTITASAKPTISSATKAQDSTLTGWTTSIAAGDILGFNVDSITTCTRVHLILKVTKT